MTHHEIPYRNMNEYEFQSQEEILRQMLLENFLQAMREDLSEWLSSLSHDVSVSADNFLSDIENGIILCQHARLIHRYTEEYAVLYPHHNIKIPSLAPSYRERGAYQGSFVARDNVANFIAWCRELGIADVVIFESDDLVLQKNEKSVILTLMEVARKAYKFGVQPPEIVRFEKEIDEEIDKEKEAVKLGKAPQKPRDLEEDNNLDTMVRNIVNKCCCSDRFPIKKLAEGKYQVGRNNALIFVRVMRKHVMVRVGGGWDTFDHYITKHDPCRTKVVGTINEDGHTKSSLPSETLRETDAKLKLLKAEHTMATSTDTSSMCSSSSDGSEGICRCGEKESCSHNNSKVGSVESNNENADPCTNFTRSIEEIDRKLRLLADRRPTIDMSIKDPMVYNNRSDRWLRSHLNTIKQNTIDIIDTQGQPPENNAQMEVDKNNNNNNSNNYKAGWDSHSTAPRALRRKANIAGNQAKPRTKSLEQPYPLDLRIDTRNLETSYDACDSVPPNSDLTEVSSVSSADSNLTQLSEPIRRSCNNISTQTDFDDIKSSKIPRSLLRNSDMSSSRIPRPVMTRARTLDAIPLRKHAANNNNTKNTTPAAKPAASSDRPGMRREKSDIPPSMRREKSNVTARNKNKQSARGGQPATPGSTPRRKDKTRVEHPVRIRNGPELRV